MSIESKVGGFTLLGLAMLAMSLVHLSDFSFGASSGHTYRVSFPQVLGLKPAASVQYAGVAVGRVLSIEPTGRRVIVTLKLDSDLAVPSDSYFSIAADGLLGEKFVSITPGGSSESLKNGAEVDGYSEVTMDTMMNNMNSLVAEMHDILSSIKDVVGNQEMKAALLDSALNMQKITGALAQTTEMSQSHLLATVQNLDRLTENLSRATANVERMMAETTDEGRTAANLRQTMENIALASKRIDHMAQAMEGVVTDPQTTDNLKTTVQNAREITDKMNKFLGKGPSNVDVGMDIAYHTKREDKFSAGLDVKLGGDDKSKYFLIGLEEIGHGNLWDVELAKKYGDVTARGGLIRDHFGLGLDFDPNEKWRLSAEAYDAEAVRLRLGVRYKLRNNTYIFTKVDDVTKRQEDRSAYFGLRQEF